MQFWYAVLKILYYHIALGMVLKRFAKYVEDRRASLTNPYFAHLLHAANLESRIIITL